MTFPYTTPVYLNLWSAARRRMLLLQTFGAEIGSNSDVPRLACIWYPAYLGMSEHSIIAAGAKLWNHQVKCSFGRTV